MSNNSQQTGQNVSQDIPEAQDVAQDLLSDTGSESLGGADDFTSLISFANLENVLKHIIKKFKSIEERNTATEESIQGLRRELEGCASTANLEEVSSELRSRVDTARNAMSGNKEAITGLENALERSRVMCGAIEKKLEACVKEKAVQDRLIREIQDSLQDKVAVAELNMFEAKFAGYTTKLEHQEVISMLNHYARLDVAERITESVKDLGTQFDHYTRTAKIDQQLQEVRDWVSDELQDYAKSQATTARMDELQNSIRDQALGFERVHGATDDKIRSLSDRVTSIYTELSSDINERALARDLQQVQSSLKRYALKAETDAFQQDCVPKLKFCVDSIKAFDDRLRAQDDAIQRVDEVLLDKACKYDIVVVNSRLEQCFQKDLGMKEFTKMYDRLEWIKTQFEQYKAAEHTRMDQFRPPDYTPMFEDLNNRVSAKADKADVVEVYQLKANRIDADELAKLQDTIHRQLEYLSVTAFGLAKLVLTETKSSESKTIRMQQKSQVLMQSEALWHWILHNEPPPNLDTLRPPPGRGRGSPGPPSTRSNLPGEVNSGVDQGDREKRVIDDAKRMQLEKKLGILGGGA